MWNFNNIFPFTNFHELNLDWVLQQIKKAVKSINTTILPDETGNLILTANDIGAIPDSHDIPAGGSPGKALIKASSADYDFAWGELNNLVGILPIAKGGTGATTADQAKTNLGIKTSYAPGDSIVFDTANGFIETGVTTGTGDLIIDYWTNLTIPADLTVANNLSVSWIRGNNQNTTGTISSVTRLTATHLRVTIAVTGSQPFTVYSALVTGSISFT